VLADGSIVNANDGENADLHRALKGGNNNLGIVTRFDLDIFQQGKMWGGFIASNISKAEFVDWFYNYSSTVTRDPKSMTLTGAMTFGDNFFAAGLVTYQTPTQDPAIFKPLTDNPITFADVLNLLPASLGNLLNTNYNAAMANITGSSTSKTKRADSLSDFLNVFGASGPTTYTAISQVNALTTPNGLDIAFSAFSYINSKEYLSHLLDLHASETAGQSFTSTLSLQTI